MINETTPFPILSKDIMDSLFEEIGEETFYEALDAFIDEITEFSEQIQDQQSMANLKVQAHSLKSSARMFGTMALAETAFELEKASKNQDQNLVNQLIPKLLQECHLTLNAVKVNDSV